jgi:hypothetical protein
MATCFCKQPCERHKFPMATKKGWVNFDPLIGWMSDYPFIEAAVDSSVTVEGNIINTPRIT